MMKPNKRQDEGSQGEVGECLEDMQVLEVLGWSKGFPERWQCGCSFNIMRVRDRGQRYSHREELADQSLRRRSPDVFSKV